MEEPRRPGPIHFSALPRWSEDHIQLKREQEALRRVDPRINTLISVFRHGDSTQLHIDAVVNAANRRLTPGSGLCEAIHRGAGPELAAACAKIGGCPEGSAVVTSGFLLPATWIIHAVGPIGQGEQILEQAYRSILSFIDGRKISSVALCPLSTGIYGFPIRTATEIALRIVREFLEDPENQAKTERIVFVVQDTPDIAIYEEFLMKYFPIGAPRREIVQPPSEIVPEPPEPRVRHSVEIEPVALVTPEKRAEMSSLPQKKARVARPENEGNALMRLFHWFRRSLPWW
jgi:O-acetyl-ADP-ribose deacetylase (regulator of RNase III)